MKDRTQRRVDQKVKNCVIPQRIYAFIQIIVWVAHSLLSRCIWFDGRFPQLKEKNWTITSETHAELCVRIDTNCGIEHSTSIGLSIYINETSIHLQVFFCCCRGSVLLFNQNVAYENNKHKINESSNDANCDRGKEIFIKLGRIFASNVQLKFRWYYTYTLDCYYYSSTHIYLYPRLIWFNQIFSCIDMKLLEKRI